MPKVNPEALRALIFAQRFSIAEFAREVGTVPSHISNILADRRGASAATIGRMADVLGVPVRAITDAPVKAAS